jgi:hypothetical protein
MSFTPDNPTPEQLARLARWKKGRHTVSGVSLLADGEGLWGDLMDKDPDKVLWDQHDKLTIARLPGGTVDGNDSVCIRLDMPDGTVVLTQMTLRLLGTVADALRQAPGARY